MSRSTRRRVETLLTLLAVLFAIVIVLVGGRVLWLASTAIIHPDSVSVPSTAATLGAGRYAAAVDEARRLARALVIDENLPGLSVALAVEGEIVWAEGFGWADIERRSPVTPLTRFRLGAASKPLTAAALALLHDRGRLDLDAPVQIYVPDYPQKQWPIVPRQLMGDVAGVHRIRGDNNDAMPSERCADLGEALPLFAGEPLVFRPGTEYRYSIYGWILLSVLVERVAGEPFPAFMTRELFGPLGMESTVLEEADGVPDNTTTFYGARAAMRTGLDLGVAAAAQAQYSCLAGAGAFLSTPSDLARFGSAMLKPGFLKAETIAAMQTPLGLESGTSTDYALGWKVERVPLAGTPARLVGHRGTPMGSTVSLLTFPDLDLVVAAASNVTRTRSVDPFAQKLAAVFTAAGVVHGPPTDGRRP